MSTAKAKFTSYSGGSASAMAADSKSAELLKDPSRTYGDAPKGLAGSKTELYRVQPTQPITTSQALGANFDGLYELADRVTNYSKCINSFDFQVTTPGATYYTWKAADLEAMLYSFRLVGKISGKCYGEIKPRMSSVYQKVMSKRDTALPDFIAQEQKDGLFPSKLTPSLNYLGFTSRIGDTDAAELAAELAGNLQNTEPQYWKVNAVVDNVYPVGATPATGGFEHVEITMGRFKASGVFAINSNKYLGEPCNFYVTYDTANIVHKGTNPTNPMVGVANHTGTLNVKNFTFDQCCELDEGAIAEAKAECMAGKVFPIPWAKDDLQTLSSATQQPKMLFTPADGTFLRHLTFCAFPATRANNTLFDHSNKCPATAIDGTLGGKILNFITELDGKQQTKYPVICTPPNDAGDNKVQYPSEDYLHQRKMLAQSVIQGPDMFYKNWSWQDNWIGAQNPLNEATQDAIGGALVAGGPAAGRLWQATCTIQQDKAGNIPNLIWYIHAELTKYLKLGPNGGSDVLNYIGAPVMAQPSPAQPASA